MNLQPLCSVLGEQRVSTSIEDRLVYARDASRMRGECLAVVWPSSPEQVAFLVEWARQEAVDLVPRGAGTGLCGGAVPQRSVVVDLSHLNAIKSVEPEGKLVHVEAGVVLGTLNRRLEPAGLFLPVIPGSHRAAAIGGLIATDAAGLRAVRYGLMGNWVQSVTLVDGSGQVRHLSGKALGDVVGREGVTGFILEAILRLAPRPRERTVTIMAFDDEAALLAQRDRWLAEPALTALEYLNRHAAALIGWEPRHHLLAEFDSDQGEIEDPGQVRDLWRDRDGLYPQLARCGHPVIEDPQLSGPGLAELLRWLDQHAIPAFGHLGLGIVHPCFAFDDGRIETLYESVAAWGGRVSGEHGIGLKKRAWVDERHREEIRRLKQIYDPHDIINRGKLS